MVKRAQLKIVHDRARVADSADCSLEECRSALSHTKTNMPLPSYLDPKRVYELLKNMRDEVLPHLCFSMIKSSVSVWLREQ